jgi:hypothetical protein
VFNATLRPDYPRERDPVGIVKLTGNCFVKNERYHFVYIDGILLAGLNGEGLYSCLQTIWNSYSFWFGNIVPAGWRKLNKGDLHNLCFPDITIVLNEGKRGRAYSTHGRYENAY